jgi:hypothetical protein
MRWTKGIEAIRIGAAALALTVPATASAQDSATPGPVQLAQGGPTVIVNGLTDFNLGSWSGSGQLRQTDSMCVGTSQSPFRYRITATGSGAGGAFTVTNGISALPYTLEHRGASGAFQTMTAGTALTGQRGSSLATCNAGTNTARLRITFTEPNLLGATAGSYSGTITLVVAPE